MKHLTKEPYASPAIDVADISAGSLLCASASGSNQDYNVKDYSDGWSDN